MPTDPITHLLNERIDRIEARLDARVDERHADLRERLDGLRQDVATLTGALLARLDAHDEYHRRNEHRWGLVRLAARYPFRLAGLAGASVMILSTAPEARALLLRFLEATRGFSP